MAVIPGLKESVFGVSYVLHESSSHNPIGPWRLRWCVLGYLIDAAQVRLSIAYLFYTKFILNFYYYAGFEDFDQRKVLCAY
jgi:hypothetical protein